MKKCLFSTLPQRSRLSAMAFLFFCLSVINHTIFAQTLAAGDMAIIGVNSDATADEISIAVLTTITTGTTIYITDYAWDGSVLTAGAGLAEGIITWVPSATIPEGSVFKISITAASPTATVSGLPGTVTVTTTSWTGGAIASGGDNWFIYQGPNATTPTNWIFGFANWSTNNAGGTYAWAPAGTTISATISNLPLGLTNGTNAIALTGSTQTTPTVYNPHYDNMVYTGIKSGTKATLLAAICNTSNWIGDETNTYDISSGGTNFPGAIPFTITSACTTPIAYSVTGGGAYCTGGAGMAVGLANSETGVSYQLQKDNVNDGAAVNGTGAAISFGTKTAAGTYTVIATRTIGACTNNMTGSVNVTINPYPPINATPTLVASTNTPCAGTQVLLTAAPATGYTAVEYLWSKNGVPVNYQNGGPGTYLVNAGNAAAQVNYSVQMIYGGYSCISTYSANTTINVAAPTTTITPNGAVSFCVNTPTTLQANAGMSNYVWKRSGTVVGTNSATYAPTVSGNHNVTVTDANGCSKTSASVSVSVKSLPTANAGADRPLCEGSSLQIGTSSVAGNTYTWSPITDLNNPYISNPTTTTTDTITYTLTVNNTTTGCSKTDNVVINSLPLPQMPSITAVTSGSSMILTANSPGATGINWYKNGANFLLNKSPNSSITVAVSNPTNTYTVKSKGTNGCLSVASMPTNAKLTNADKAVFAAYPNPTSSLLTVEIGNVEMNTSKLLLFNSLGQIVIEKEVTLSASKAQTELDMSQLAAGIYHLSFGEYMQKIIKE